MHREVVTMSSRHWNLDLFMMYKNQLQIDEIEQPIRIAYGHESCHVRTNIIGAAS